MEIDRSILTVLAGMATRMSNEEDKDILWGIIKRAELDLQPKKVLKPGSIKEHIPEPYRSALTEADIKGLEAAIMIGQKLPAITIVRDVAYRSKNNLSLAEAKAMIDPFYD